MIRLLSPSRRTLAAAAVALAAAVAAPVPAAHAADALSAAQADQVRDIVRQYLIENPEVLVEAMQALEAKQQAAAEQAQQDALKTHAEQIFRDPGSPVFGNPDGDVTLVEFFDYQCGYCKAVHPSVLKAIGEDKGLRVVMKEFPILGPASVYASRAALASREQGKYEALHNALMSHDGKLDEATVDRIAGKVGLDMEKLKKDMAAPAVDDQIGVTMALARALGIRGTPAFVVGDTLLPGAVPLERLKQEIAKAREAG
ncbi:DsbA family protein [Caenispirillum bisanense]|uniref:Protein-disulfide isomerase n=1 Tax=Caenispirillum bisanense TaxID=414052 RepID=A0A286GRA3_9PROT|nr:DsbA family protein [Caenispirillum bisanense]SOD98063.1 Protein-disulfide isomerase [Caenispirillum bisanense]